MYRPLPKELTIKNSVIEGLGLFATANIKTNTFIGVTHIRDEQFENKYIRTPLGGFINHSDTPNSYLVVSQEWDDYLIYNILRYLYHLLSQILYIYSVLFL